jgi:uncharacterized protein
MSMATGAGTGTGATTTNTTGTSVPPNYSKDIATDESLTVLVTHHVRHDKHEAFQRWSQDANVLAQKFDGFISAEVIRPATTTNAVSLDIESGHNDTSNVAVPAGHDEYIAIIRFDNFQHLNAWMKSPERQSMSDRLNEFADDVPTVTFHSLEHWFVTADDVKAHNEGQTAVVRVPNKWKMLLVTMTVIYTQSLWIPKVTKQVIQKPLHPYLFQFINMIIVVCLVTFILFPILTRLLSFWLMPGVDYRAKLMELVPTCCLRHRPQSTKANVKSIAADGGTKV